MHLMKIMTGLLVAISALTCTEIKHQKATVQDANTTERQPAQQASKTVRDSIPVEPARFTDPRDGESYRIVKIGDQVWLAENLRYSLPGSWLNPDNPSVEYGRLYPAGMLNDICPAGWKLPTDADWNQLELFLGMSISEMATTGWRGEHGINMKSVAGWGTDLATTANGNNSSGFNVLPAGFCDSDNHNLYFEGLGRSSGFWAAPAEGVAWQRWLAAPLKGVNRQPDDLSSDFAVSCRCLKE